MNSTTSQTFPQNTPATSPKLKTALNEDYLSTWKLDGYQDWLRQQQRIQHMQSKHELALDIRHQSSVDELTNFPDLPEPFRTFPNLSGDQKNFPRPITSSPPSSAAGSLPMSPTDNAGRF